MGHGPRLCDIPRMSSRKYPVNTKLRFETGTKSGQKVFLGIVVQVNKLPGFIWIKWTEDGETFFEPLAYEEDYMDEAFEIIIESL